MFLTGLMINTRKTSCISKPAKKVQGFVSCLKYQIRKPFFLVLNSATFPLVILLLHRAGAALEAQRILAPKDKDPSEHVSVCAALRSSNLKVDSVYQLRAD